MVFMCSIPLSSVVDRVLHLYSDEIDIEEVCPATQERSAERRTSTKWVTCAMRQW